MPVACLSVGACAHFVDVFTSFSALCIAFIFPISTVTLDYASDALDSSALGTVNKYCTLKCCFMLFLERGGSTHFILPGWSLYIVEKKNMLKL